MLFYQLFKKKIPVSGLLILILLLSFFLFIFFVYSLFIQFSLIEQNHTFLKSKLSEMLLASNELQQKIMALQSHKSKYFYCTKWDIAFGLINHFSVLICAITSQPVIATLPGMTSLNLVGSSVYLLTCIFYFFFINLDSFKKEYTKVINTSELNSVIEYPEFLFYFDSFFFILFFYFFFILILFIFLKENKMKN